MHRWRARCRLLSPRRSRTIVVGASAVRNGRRDGRVLTSTQLSSFISGPSSFVLDPLTASLLLGGARSSALLRAGLFLSSILDIVDGRGEAEVVVVAGIRSARDTGPTSAREGGRGSDAHEVDLSTVKTKVRYFKLLYRARLGREDKAEGLGCAMVMGRKRCPRPRRSKFRGSKSQTERHGPS